MEDDLGPGRFLLLLAAAHLAGSIAHGAFDPRSAMPCVGASAGISGVLAYYALAFPHARIGLLFWFLWRWLRLGAIWMLLLYALLQLLGAWRQVAGASHVSYLAHLGGMGVGALAALALRTKSSPAERRW